MERKRQRAEAKRLLKCGEINEKEQETIQTENEGKQTKRE